MCDCIKLVNEHLADRNTKVNRTIAYQQGELKVMGAIISTFKVDEKKRGKPVSLTAAYCPFCGEKYEEDAR